MSIKNLLSEIRNDHNWSNDDLLVVIHVKQKDRKKLETLFFLMGIKNQDAVEIVKDKSK